MSVHLSGISAAALAAAELMTICLAGFTVFRRWRYTFSESCACTLVTVLMVLSCLFQLAFIAGVPAVSIAAEVLLCGLAIITIFRNAIILRQELATVLRFFTTHPVFSATTGIVWCYLILLAFFIPPQSIHWHNLSQVLLFQQQGAFFPSLAAGSFTNPEQTLSPVNITILAHLFLRSHTDFGIGLIGFMAYLSIGFSTYALSRRYAWPPTAFTVTVLVMSMPRLVYLSTTPGYEILPAAVALFCLVSIYRAVESPNVWDLCFLALGLLFMISGPAVSLAFPAILVPLSCLLLFRRHGFTIWWKLIAKHRRIVLLALVPALVFSQSWLFLYNRIYQGDWINHTGLSSVALNPDGIQGAVANFFRYILESAHFTRPVDLLCRWAAGFSITNLWQSIYGALISPVFDNLGAVVPFQISWIPDERLSWFGPFGFLLVLPAVVIALVRAPRRLKAIAISLLGYFFLITLILAWTPENVRFFTIFYVCGGFCIAFFLPPWRISQRSRQGLQIAGALLLLYAGVCNYMKPAVGFRSVFSPTGAIAAGSKTEPELKGVDWKQLLAGSIWVRSGWGRDRLGPSRKLFVDNRVERISALIPEDAKLRIIFKDKVSAYPFLLAFPKAECVSVANLDFDLLKSKDTVSPVYLLFVDLNPPDLPELSTAKVIRRTTSEALLPGGVLLQIP